uniref:Uncharacterized protein n=1 Tax=Arundo donax TaxID=35708 RepID=A0A0A8ZFM7_ARUDO
MFINLTMRTCGVNLMLTKCCKFCELINCVSCPWGLGCY